MLLNEPKWILANRFAPLACLIMSAVMISGCSRVTNKDRVEETSAVASGPGIDPYQLGCEALQTSFVDDGIKFDEAKEKFDGSTSNNGNGFSTWRGVKKAEPYKGPLDTLLQSVDLPGGVLTEGDCTQFRSNSSSDKYDACSEMATFKKRLKLTAKVWDTNANSKKCYEGASFEVIKNPEFAYCDNQCAFNDEQCVACEISYNSGQKDKMICKTLSSAKNALGAFCKTPGVSCGSFDAVTACKTGKGIDFAGPGGTVLSGSSDEFVEAEISAYVGASESTAVAAIAAGGEKLSARGTAKGKVGFKKRQGIGSMFTPTGFGVNGLAIECYLNVTGIASLTYDSTAGIGADFVFAKGEATFDSGGSFSLTKTYIKTSPTFSGAGMSKDAIFKQCVNNYVAQWIGVELERWVGEYSGLSLVKRSVQNLISQLHLDKAYTFDSHEVFCMYPNYDASNGLATGELRIFPDPDGVKVQWSHYYSLWIDPQSEKLKADDDKVRPFLKDLKNGPLSKQRLLAFYNEVVVPASSKESRENWRMSRCWN